MAGRQLVSQPRRLHVHHPHSAVCEPGTLRAPCDLACGDQVDERGVHSGALQSLGHTTGLGKRRHVLRVGSANRLRHDHLTRRELGIEATRYAEHSYRRPLTQVTCEAATAGLRLRRSHADQVGSSPNGERFDAKRGEYHEIGFDGTHRR